MHVVWRTAVLASTVLAVLVATVVPAGASDTIDARSRTADEVAVEAELVRLHQAARAEGAAGHDPADEHEPVPPMSGWTDIRRVSRGWAEEVATTTVCGGDTMCHNVQPYSEVPFQQEYGCWDLAGENVASRGGDGLAPSVSPEQLAQQLFDGWMHSQGHRHTVMNPSFDEFGVGVHVESTDDPASGPTWRVVAVANFRMRDTDCSPDGTTYPESSTRDDPAAARPPQAGAAARAVTRVAGADRIATTLALAEVWDTADTAIVASAADYPDALAAAPLSAVHDAPVLLSLPDVLDPRVATALDRLGTSRVLMMGGPGALSVGLQDQIASRGITVDRIAGATRWDTAAQAAREVARATGAVREVLLVEGGNADPARGWPDALAAAAHAARTRTPVLLTRADQLPEATRAALEDLRPDRRLTVVGGQVAVSDAVQARAADVAGVASTRLMGQSRYATSRVLDRSVVPDPADVDVVYLATGRHWADALAAGPAAAHANGTMLLVDGRSTRGAGPTLDHLANRYPGHDVVLAGGADAVTPEVAAGLSP